LNDDISMCLEADTLM